MNPIRPESTHREKRDVAAVHRLQLDLDKTGPESLRQVLLDVSSQRLPAPAAVVQSSKRNYQVIWNAEPSHWTPGQAEDTMRRLAAHYAGDSSVADVARVMRLPGYRNRKPGRNNAPVHWTPHGGERVTPHQFDHLPQVEIEPRQSPARPPEQPGAPRAISQSERDWAWTKDQLRRGTPAARVTDALERRRPDKNKPRDYAQRTVRNAQTALARERTASASSARTAPAATPPR